MAWVLLSPPFSSSYYAYVAQIGGADQVVRMWDARSGMQVSTAFAKASVASLELSRDSKYLISAAGKEVTFWDAATLVPQKMYTMSILPPSPLSSPLLSSPLLSSPPPLSVDN